MTGESVEVSVLIPTLNAGPEFAAVLDAIAGQTTDFGFEVLLVDSGSSDGTLELGRRHAARVLRIPKSKFSHGGARNYGISAARGDYVALTVQDALPADDGWLRKLVENMVGDEKVAGVYGRQIPRPDCNPFSRYALERHFTNRSERRVQAIEDPERYESLAPMRKLETIAFDDVNSCVRRSVWKRHPFGPVPFGEDLDWSERVLKAGYRIVYEPASAVVHSHNRSAFYEMKRAYLAHKLLCRMLGLRLLPTLGELRRRLPTLIRQRVRLAQSAGGGPRLCLQAVTRSLGDQTGIFLGGLAGSDPRGNAMPHFVDRFLSTGV
jgi:rhamnosyltransferase